MAPTPSDEPAASPFGDLDIEAIFEPLPLEDAFGAVLSEAGAMLEDVRSPLEAEVWGSDMIAALAGGDLSPAEAMDTLREALVPTAEEAATPGALALLRVLSAIGSTELRAAARGAADGLAARGVADPEWAAAIGSPDVGECWCYGDEAGLGEAVTMSFGYGTKRHAVSVLIDNGVHGGIKDAWVGAAAHVLTRTRALARRYPKIIFEMIDPVDARTRVERAIAAGECPEQPEEIEDVSAYRALLHARVVLLPPPSAASATPDVAT